MSVIDRLLRSFESSSFPKPRFSSDGCSVGKTEASLHGLQTHFLIRLIVSADERLRRQNIGTSTSSNSVGLQHEQSCWKNGASILNEAVDWHAPEHEASLTSPWDTHDLCLIFPGTNLTLQGLGSGVVVVAEKNGREWS